MVIRQTALAASGSICRDRALVRHPRNVVCEQHQHRLLAALRYSEPDQNDTVLLIAADSDPLWRSDCPDPSTRDRCGNERPESMVRHPDVRGLDRPDAA